MALYVVYKLATVGEMKMEITMFTLRADLLKALGIHYETSSKFLVLRGRLYKRGPSFSPEEYRKAARYFDQRSNNEGSACLLVESPTELTIWLEASKTGLTLAQRAEQPQLAVSSEQLVQHSSNIDVHLSYRSA